MNPKSRPAETAGVGASIALLICYFAGIDNDAVLVAMGTIIGFIPAMVTWIVELARKP